MIPLHHKKCSLLPILLAMVMLSISGCGGGAESVPMGTAKGTVTLDDKPYDGAQLIFFNLKKGSASEATIKADGSYELGNEVPAGDYVVYLAPKSAVVSDADMGAGMGGVKQDQTVNAKYWNETTTDINVTLKEGMNDIPVKLSK
ncbi:MAG: hypothetical protein R3C01_02380 [Planctomycetaceae bacterium]